MVSAADAVRPSDGPMVTRFGKYRAVRLLAEGRVAQVHLCDDPDLGLQAAVKAFSRRVEEDAPDEVAHWRRRFLLEARWLGRIEHPNVVYARVLDASSEGMPFFVMPYLPATLADEIGQDGPAAARLSPRRACDVLDGILAGLVGLHAAGLVHGNVRPGNVLLTAVGTGDVKLCDLSAARFPEDDPAAVPVTSRGNGGEDGYVAPEVQRNPVAADVRADIYSAAAIAFRMLAGGIPGTDSVAPAATLAGLGLPDALTQPISAALAEAPDARPASAAVFRAALAAARPTLDTA